MALLPYGLRTHVGRIGALCASLLLAISPAFVYSSRSVDGSIVVAFCGLGLLVVLADSLSQPRDVHLLAGSGLLVMGLLAAPSVYTLLAVLLTFPLFLRIWAKLRDRGPLDELWEAWASMRDRPRAVRTALTLSLGLVLAFGLAFAFDVGGLQMALDQLGQWAGVLRFPSRSSWNQVLLLLLVYEGLSLVFGLAGFFLTRKRTDVWSVLLRYWLAFVLVFSVMSGSRPQSGILLAMLPLILGAGWALQELARRLLEVGQDVRLWALLAVSFFVCCAAYVQLVQYLSFPQPTHLLRMAALAVFALSSYALVWSLSGPTVPLRAAALSLLLLLLLVMIRNAVRLNYAQARDAGEPMVVAATSPQVLELAQEAARLSSQLEGDERVLDLLVDERLEVSLGWYLRGFEQVTYFSALPAEPVAGGIITLGDASAPTGYVGLRFALRSLNTTLKRAPTEWLRWWVGYKPMSIGTETEAIVLWVRKPLT
jgi:predicted membrane-bound mannosyltransferase